MSERYLVQFSCIFTYDDALSVYYENLFVKKFNLSFLYYHVFVFLPVTHIRLVSPSTEFTCKPLVFGLLVDYFSTLNWRWVILLLYFVTTLLILSVAKVSRVSFENDESIDPNTSWSDEFLFRFSVVRRPFPDFWIRFYQWLYSIFDGIWKAVPCFFVASLHVIMLSCLMWLLFCHFFWRVCIFLSYRSRA